jgi:hypothetical protein
MKYAVEMNSCAMILSFIKIGSDIQKLIGEYTDRHIDIMLIT